VDEQQFRERLVTLDADSRDDRVKRWGHIVPLTYRAALPDLLWEYSIEATRLYINGHYMGVILFCAALAEIVLADQLKGKPELMSTAQEKPGLSRMADLAYQHRIVGDQEKSQIHALGKLRNDLIHVNVGKLTRRAKQKDGELGGISDNSWGVGLFLVPPWEGGIQLDALTHLTNIGNLAVRLYGWTEDEIATVEGRA
jgi:hypothetical protein